MTIFGGTIDRIRRLFGWHPSSEIRLRHFEDIWPVELAAINRRRKRIEREGVKRNPSPTPAPEEPLDEGREGRRDSKQPRSRPRSPDPDKIFNGGNNEWRRTSGEMGPGADAEKPEPHKMRPQPVPCDAIGLCLSGGGIRSAAVGLGGLQALAAGNWLDEIDYLSTVSGGGYIGASLSAAMSKKGGGTFPFGTDVFDSDAVAHLRNFSNYLMPRGHSGLRNGAEGAAVVLRGLLANFVILTFFELFFALLTAIVLYNYVPGAYDSLITGAHFRLSMWSTAVLGGVLVFWAIARSMSRSNVKPSDTRGPLLVISSALLVVTVLIAFINLQPIMIGTFIRQIYMNGASGAAWTEKITGISTLLTAFSGIIAFFSSSLGRFLQKSQRSSRLTTLVMRSLAKIGLWAAAAVVPMLLWLAYIWLSAALLEQWRAPRLPDFVSRLLTWSSLGQCYLTICAFTFLVTRFFKPNGYSLHRFYRDRLSKAFLFKPANSEALDGLKLSEINNDAGPYHIVNAALNVQGSVQANYRGRDADFFIFTTDFVGSDLTMYTTTDDRSTRRGMAPTRTMESIDRALDLATAMAISGAAISANMGSNTIRALSPTLALLNIRLGYWMKNPRGMLLAKGSRRITQFFKSWFYLFVEILNLHDETSPVVYLTDGGHIENLGLYELLKRGCRTIIVVDAEADPEMAFPSLLKLERYARIDLGIRIELPWEHIARAPAPVDPVADCKPVEHGPHCALGTITYADGATGKLLYFKSSITGDEKDYVLDYRRRNSDFPHETTGDQFFSEEQFEMYRALGFHMIDRTLRGYDKVVRSSGDPVAIGLGELLALFPQRKIRLRLPIWKTRSTVEMRE